MNDRKTKNIVFVGNDKLPRKAFGGAKGTVREKENTDGRGQRAAALAPDSTYRVQRGLYLQEFRTATGPAFFQRWTAGAAVSARG